MNYIKRYRVNNSKCRWYKQNWQQLPKQAKFYNSKSSDSLLPLLELEDLKEKNSKIDGLVDFISEKFK